MGKGATQRGDDGLFYLSNLDPPDPLLSSFNFLLCLFPPRVNWAGQRLHHYVFGGQTPLGAKLIPGGHESFWARYFKFCIFAFERDPRFHPPANRADSGQDSIRSETIVDPEDTRRQAIWINVTCPRLRRQP